MTCVHLQRLESALIASGHRETFRGQAWSRHCREWVYFQCYLPLDFTRAKFSFDACVRDHEHNGTHDGRERGFVCTVHEDGIMGLFPGSGAAPTFEP